MDNLFLQHLIDRTWEDDLGTWCNLAVTRHGRLGSVSIECTVETGEQFSSIVSMRRCAECFSRWKKEAPEIYVEEVIEALSKFKKELTDIVAPQGIDVPDDVLFDAVRHLKNKAAVVDSHSKLIDAKQAIISTLKTELSQRDVAIERLVKFKMQAVKISASLSKKIIKLKNLTDEALDDLDDLDDRDEE